MAEDHSILKEFQKLLARKAVENIIDLDNKFIYKFDLQIHPFEDVMKGKNRTVPPHRWSYHRILLIKKGSCEFTMVIYKFKGTKNTLCVLFAK